MKLHDITLSNGMEVTINYSSKTVCPKCKGEIWSVATKRRKLMKVEMISLALWGVHDCERIKKNIVKLNEYSVYDLPAIDIIVNDAIGFKYILKLNSEKGERNLDCFVIYDK